MTTKIIRHYTTPEGEHAVEYERTRLTGHTGRGHAIAVGTTDAEIAEVIDLRHAETDRIDIAERAAMKGQKPPAEPPAPGSFAHRQQCEIECSFPFLPQLSKEWDEYWRKKRAAERQASQQARTQ